METPKFIGLQINEEYFVSNKKIETIIFHMKQSFNNSPKKLDSQAHIETKINIIDHYSPTSNLNTSDSLIPIHDNDIKEEFGPSYNNSSNHNISEKDISCKFILCIFIILFIGWKIMRNI